MRWLTIGLLAPACALVAASLFSENSWFAATAGNLATEIVGILVTLLFVERLLSHRDAAEKRLRARGATRRMKKALGLAIEAFGFAIVRVQRPGVATKVTSLDQLLDDAMTDELESLDFGKEQIGTRIYSRCESLRRVSENVIDVYGVNLPPDYVSQIDELLAEDYLMHVHVLLDAPDSLEQAHQLFGSPAMTSRRRSFFAQLRKFVKLHDAYADPEERIKLPLLFQGDARASSSYRRQLSA